MLYTAPAISIGLPTYNRAETLDRAIASALGQTYGNLELIVSDNGSVDATQRLCRQWAARDPRVRYLRHESNAGPTSNFNAVISEMRGEYALLLADDDWLDPDYVERCLAELRRDEGLAIVAGRACHWRQGRVVGQGLDTQLDELDPVRRVRRYLREVDDNGIFYGVVRCETLQRAAPLREALGGDWLLIAGVVSTGRVGMLPSPSVHRTVGGTSRTTADVLRSLPRSAGWRRRVPYLVSAAIAFNEMAWRSPVYAGAGAVGRLHMAITAAPALVRWRATLWLLVGAALLRVRRRRRGKLVWRAVSWTMRRSGGEEPPMDLRDPAAWAPSGPQATGPQRSPSSMRSVRPPTSGQRTVPRAR